MIKFDLPLQLGGTFTLSAKIKNKVTGEYLLFTGAVLSFHVKNERGNLIEELSAVTDDGIELSEGDTRFSVRVEYEDTEAAKLKSGSYCLTVLWPDGSKKGLMTGSLGISEIF